MDTAESECPAKLRVGSCTRHSQRLSQCCCGNPGMLRRGLGRIPELSVLCGGLERRQRQLTTDVLDPINSGGRNPTRPGTGYVLAEDKRNKHDVLSIPDRPSNSHKGHLSFLFFCG